MSKYKGQLKGFPDEVVQKMLYYQVQQGNEEDVSVFEKKASSDGGWRGMTWGDTPEGYDFWKKVIHGNFELFFQKYPKKPKLPKYFIIERDADNPLWEKFINWLNQEHGSHWGGNTDGFYGYDGSKSNGGTDWNESIYNFKNNPEVITLEYWNACINGNNQDNQSSTDQNNNNMEIIGYKFKRGFEKYEVAVMQITGQAPSGKIKYDYRMPSSIQKIKEAGVLDLWFEPVYKKKYELPIIAGYKGEDLGDKVKYGCKTVSVSTIRELVELGIPSLLIIDYSSLYHAVTGNRDSYVVYKNDLENILEYFDNK